MTGRPYPGHVSARLSHRSNNCGCHDHCNTTECFQGDVNATLAFGFDSIKLDGCGEEENVELWYDLFNATIEQNGGGAGMLVENVRAAGQMRPGMRWLPVRHSPRLLTRSATTDPTSRTTTG